MERVLRTGVMGEQVVWRDRRQLTLTIRCHMWHAGILHHGCRIGSSHHGRRVGTGKVTLGSHGKLLIVIHDLRLVLGWTLLHVRVLRLGGTTVECWTSCSGDRNAIRVAIRGRIHGWSAGRAVQARLDRRGR